MFDSTNTKLYITQKFGIAEYNMNTHQFSIVAGSTFRGYRPGVDERKDGNLLEARFDGNFGLYQIINACYI